MNLKSRFKLIHKLLVLLLGVEIFVPVKALAAPYGSGDYGCGLYGQGCGPAASFMDKYGWLIFFALLIIIAWLLFLLLACRRKKCPDKDDKRHPPPPTTINPNQSA
ncbi:hypothetical protein HYS85_00705 [Candidatus Saccharibacteria bacterium]|nr:hypothetical protein [Candidatus Saccharibacteria bacterium]